MQWYIWGYRQLQALTFTGKAKANNYSLQQKQIPPLPAPTSQNLFLQKLQGGEGDTNENDQCIGLNSTFVVLLGLGGHPV